KELVAFLNHSGLKTDLIQVDDSLPTSEVLVHLDEKNNATYEICEPVAWDNLQLTDSLVKRTQEAGLLIYGSLASRQEQTKETLSSLLENDAIRLIDVNLRKPYDKKEIVEPLLEKSDIIKLNDDELAVFASWNNKSGVEEKKLVKWLASHYGAGLICVTKGEHGALLFAEGQFYEHPGFTVNTVDSVGAGDAFLAGLIAALFEDKPYDEALAFACGTGAFVASKAGATPKYNMSKIEQILASR
ncbi:MAG TPA: PfkB family carbohydrate kinase, partial [Sunxiuqinia sp.]|nr:PfkB family carbohydrate kinase [Sunxiuqinia sp.]